MKSKIVIALTIFAFVSCGKKTGGNTGAPDRSRDGYDDKH